MSVEHGTTDTEEIIQRPCEGTRLKEPQQQEHLGMGMAEGVEVNKGETEHQGLEVSWKSKVGLQEE